MASGLVMLGFGFYAFFKSVDRRAKLSILRDGILDHRTNQFVSWQGCQSTRFTLDSRCHDYIGGFISYVGLERPRVLTCVREDSEVTINDISALTLSAHEIYQHAVRAREEFQAS